MKQGGTDAAYISHKQRVETTAEMIKAAIKEVAKDYFSKN
jgi:hypothetical protein